MSKKKTSVLQAVLLPLADLETNTGQVEGLPQNPRLIKDEKFKKLKKSIEDNPEMLALRELLVYPIGGGKYIIIGGNMRYAAMKELGYKDAPCKVIPEETSVENLRAYTIKDNSGFGEWDMDMLANEWDLDLLDAWGVDIPADFGPQEDDDEEAKEDEFDELTDEVEAVCQPGDVWELGEHRLMCGDSTKRKDVATLMKGEKAALWLTDPPYNVAVENSQGMTIANDNMKSDDFRKFLKEAFDAASSVMAKGCPFYIWFASIEHMNFEGALNDVGLRVKQELIWNKSQFILGRSHYQWKHEPCLYGWKGDSCRYFTDRRNCASVIEDEGEIDINKMKVKELRDLLHRIYESGNPTTVINCSKPNKDTEHPTMKPVRLFGYQITNSSQRGDIILDTFGGSGTTIVAAEQLHRKARLMELDPHYCDVIIARWEKLTGKKATKITD